MKVNNGNRNQKLTNEKVKEIRKRYEKGESQQVLAKSFDVSQTMVSNVVNNRMWRDDAFKSCEERIAENIIIIESNSRQIRDLKSKNTKLMQRVIGLEEWRILAEDAIKSQQERIESLEAQLNE